MKKLVLITLFIISNIIAYAQIAGVLNKTRNKIINESVKKVDSENKNQTTDKNAGTSENINDTGLETTTNKPVQTSAQENQGSIKAYSKYDFVPGEKIIAFEDFMQTNVGDFPERWNTNASAEVVTIDGKQGHWLMFTKGGVFAPELIVSSRIILHLNLTCFAAAPSILQGSPISSPVLRNLVIHRNRKAGKVPIMFTALPYFPVRGMS